MAGLPPKIPDQQVASERLLVPAYVSKKKLAEQLDVAESTVDELVRREVLPQPYHLSSGCVRWSWQQVDLAIRSLRGSPEVSDPDDPYITGARNATKEK
jgi:predicted DNA-binding transcriptional regulator AlpA